jgi:hypothetical protein
VHPADWPSRAPSSHVHARYNVLQADILQALSTPLSETCLPLSVVAQDQEITPANTPIFSLDHPTLYLRDKNEHLQIWHNEPHQRAKAWVKKLLHPYCLKATYHTTPNMLGIKMKRHWQLWGISQSLNESSTYGRPFVSALRFWVSCRVLLVRCTMVWDMLELQVRPRPC